MQPQTQQAGQQPGTPPTVLVVPVIQNNRLETYNSRTAMVLGPTQIIIGVLLIIFSALAMAFHVWATNAYFYALIAILAGSFQIASAKTKTRCWIITTLVFSILAAVFASGAVITGSLGAIFGADQNHTDRETAGRSCSGVVFLLGLAEMIIAIVSAALCCNPLCVNNPRSQGVVIAGPQQQQFVIGQQQYIAGQQQSAPGQQQFFAMNQTSAPTYTTAVGQPPAYSDGDRMMDGKGEKT